MADAPRFSVVVPTFQRRELVLECVHSLARQRFEQPWEIVVVVDGSTDGTAEALGRLRLKVSLKIVEQPNRGLSAARNAGAAVAGGELVLFLDDDMEADPEMLAEHDRSHREGADAVMGDMPMHPDSPPTLIADAVRGWAEERSARLKVGDGKLRFHDLLGGQLSVRRQVVEELGGFDREFTARGAFGGEDIDFGYRLLRSGSRLVFNPAAISRQKYVVTPANYLRQWRDAGRASVALARRYPERRAQVQESLAAHWGLRRWLWRPLLGTPLVGPALLAAVRSIALHGVRDGQGSERAKRLFFVVRDAERLRGAIEAGGLPDRPQVHVLAYHAIEDLSGDPVMAPYGVPSDVFARQLDALTSLGFRFVGLTEALEALDGQGPDDVRRALLTFDDCYVSLLEAGVPLLRSRGIPAVAFAVSGRLGGTSEWTRSQSAAERPLLDADGLRRLAEAGVEIGAHSHTHPALPRLRPDELASEVRGSVDELERRGLARPRAFAYPYGEWDAAARDAVRDAGLAAAFTTRIGIARPSSDRLALPRIEITPREVGWRLRAKLAAASAPGPIARRVARRSLR
jgi:glycosyltransferase involved in cell wall biosynthesis/peptidoglycan/xylan/chitin deacetylase (PgdA/CDA1 family)